MNFINWNNNDQDLSQSEIFLISDIKNYNNKKEYFNKKKYLKLNIDEDTINYFLISSFIRNYYVSKYKGMSVLEVRTSLALYTTIKNGNFKDVESFLDSAGNASDCLINRYIANISNYAVDYDTLDETRSLLINYHNYYLNKHKKLDDNKILIKEKENENN